MKVAIKRVIGRWAAQLISADGERIEAQYSGRNLITNHGLDLIGTRGLCWYHERDSAVPHTLYAHVGTGSAEINADSVTLDGLLASTANNGGHATDIQQIAEGHYKITYTRQFDKAEVDGANLTRAAVSPGLIGDPREMFSQWLFTDANGDPITITPSNQHLRLTWQIEIILSPWPANTVTTDEIGGVTRHAKLAIHYDGGDLRRASDLRAIDAILTGRMRIYDNWITPDDIDLSVYTGPVSPQHRWTPQHVEAPAYSPGSRERSCILKYDTAHGNGTIKGAIFREIYSGSGLLLRFEDGDEPEKTDTKELDIKVTVTW